MATVKLQQKTYDNFSGGYVCEQAYLAEKLVSFVGDSKNIDIYATDNNNGYGFKKMLGNTLYKKIEGEKVVGLFKYQYKKDKYYLVVHTVNDEEGKLYYVDNASRLILLKRGLDKDATSSSFVNFSQTLPEKVFYGIFGNGSNNLLSIRITSRSQVVAINESDDQNRLVTGSILETYMGRIWTAVDDRIHWSKSLDPFNWSETDDAGYQQLDSDIVGIVKYSGGLIISTKSSIYYCTKDNTSNGFVFTSLAPNNALSTKGMVKHDDFLLYFAADGIYPVELTEQDIKKVQNDISWLIRKKFASRDNSQNEKLFALSVTSQGRNEVWFNVPLSNYPNQSCIFIYRCIQGRQDHYYWLPPRIQQKVNCMVEFNNMILSGNDNGEILRELTGKTFNGENIEAIAELPEFDFNGTHNKQKFKIFAYVEAQEENKFYLDYFFDGEITAERQLVEDQENAQMFIWGEDDWDDDNSLWSWITLIECDLDKPRKHNRLKLKFVSEDASQDFTINKISTTKVKVKDK